MKNTVIKRFSTLLLLLPLPVLGNAQTIRGDFNLANYPEVSFVWNEYDPNVLNAEQFLLVADNMQIPVRIENLPFIDTLPKPKTILFLWEDLNHRSHDGQSRFTQMALSAFLNNLIPNVGDKFNVGIFDRRRGNDSESTIHTLLSKKFTSDCEALAEKVNSYKPNYDFFSNQQNSELYIAIEEGIELLSNQGADGMKAIVVFTSGSNQDSYGGRNSIDESRAVARKIPVYVVKFPIPGCEHCTNIELICQKTFGLGVETDNAQIALEHLFSFYDQMGLRHHGQEYRISFHAPYNRDGKQHLLYLNVGGRDYTIAFTSPSFSLKFWILDHRLYAAIAAAILLVFIILLIYALLYRTKKRRRKFRKLTDDINETTKKAMAAQAALEEFKRRTETGEREREEREQGQYLLHLMQAKNLFPRLQYTVDEKMVTYTITKPKTTIGRYIDNDLILASDSISRHHAVISFNGSAFEIQDLGSTNRVIVNGIFSERTILNNGDIIGLGLAVIYFKA